MMLQEAEEASELFYLLRLKMAKKGVETFIFCYLVIDNKYKCIFADSNIKC